MNKSSSGASCFALVSYSILVNGTANIGNNGTSNMFFNADNVRARMAQIAAALPKGTRWFVLDTTAITQIDTTAATALDQIAADVAARGLRFGLAELNAEVRDLLDRAGVLDRIGRDMLFDDLGDVLEAFRRADPADPPARPSPLDLDDQDPA